MFGAISGFIRGTKRVPIIEDPNDENYWEKVDINTMTRLELRIALDSRGKGRERRRGGGIEKKKSPPPSNSRLTLTVNIPASLIMVQVYPPRGARSASLSDCQTA